MSSSSEQTARAMLRSNADPRPTYPLYAFTPAEFRRLWSVRQAVIGGYYTDAIVGPAASNEALRP